MNPILRFQLTTQIDGRGGGECKLSSVPEGSYKDMAWIMVQAGLNDLTNFI
jgi:hypothetical protein